MNRKIFNFKQSRKNPKYDELFKWKKYFKEYISNASVPVINWDIGNSKFKLKIPKSLNMVDFNEKDGFFQ